MVDVPVRWVPYGRAAGAALRAELAEAKAGDPLRPATVVVASNQVGVAVRRQLASGVLGPVCGAGPGLIGVGFVTPYRLAELLGAAPLARQGRRPISTPVLAATVRSVLRAEPGVFAPVADHPATESALVASYRELRDLAEPDLDALAGQSRRAAEVVRVVRAARAALAGAWYDEEDLMASATALAADGGERSAAVAELGRIVVHLPQRLSRHVVELLLAVASAGPDALAVVAGTTGHEGADAEVRAAVARLGGAPPTAEEIAAAGLEHVVAPDRTRIVTTSDADDEVRAAVRAVVDAARAGTPLDRIAVLHAAAEPYARLLHDQLTAADIATNGAAEVPLAGRLASRALLELLDLPRAGYRRHDVFAWLTGFPVLDGGSWAPTTSWERLSRRAGVVAGRDQWDRRLHHLAHELEAQADELAAEQPDAEDEAPTWRIDRLRADAARARSLRRFVVGLIDQLEGAARTPASWKQRAEWARDLLASAIGGPARQAAWPPVERRAAERLDLALHRLAALDDVEHGPVELDVFTRTLATELESDLGRSGRFGEGVLVGPASLGVGLDLDLVIVLGLAEGTFPAPPRDDSLLPDPERAAAGAALPLRQDQVDRLHHWFLAALAGSTRHLLLVPKGDLRRSRERVPSRWVLEVASVLAGERWWSPDLLHSPDGAHGGPPWLSHIASFDAGLRRLASPATAQEHRLRQLLAAVERRADLAAVAAVVDPTAAAGVEVLDAHRSDRFTRFDGDLRGQPVPSPTERGTSATRLESWARCPHGYFVRHVLRVEPVESPEAALQIDALHRGDLVHRALEGLVKEALADGTVPGPDEPWSAEHHERLDEIAREVADEKEREGVTGHDVLWRRDRRQILDELHRVLREDDDRRRQHRTTPIAAELPFGLEDQPPVRIELPDGRTLDLRGLADRVDRTEAGSYHVIDYKTGSTRAYDGLSPDDPHQGGRHLQLAVYAEAVRQRYGLTDEVVEAAYWFTADKAKAGRNRAGRVERGYPVTPAISAEAGRALATIVTGIEDGLFPPHPGPPTTSPFTECLYCDPDELGAADVRRRWERKRLDPALAAYLDLTGEGEELTEDGSAGSAEEGPR